MRFAKMAAAAGLVLAVAFAGCSGGSDSTDGEGTGAPFKFAGTWTFRHTVTEDPQGWSADDRDTPLGGSYDATNEVTVAGTAVMVRDRSSRFREVYNGVVDPDAGTLRAVYRYDGNVHIVTVLELKKATADTMTGTWTSDESASPGFPSGKHTKHTIAATRN